MGEGSDFSMDLEFSCTAGELYRQFATREGIRNWWTLDCEMEETEGGRAAFRFPGSGFHAKVEIVELRPAERVEWKVIEQRHAEDTGWDDLHDWEGTTIRFEIEPCGAGRSRLQFTHEGLAPLQCAETCSSIWSYYLNDSLRAYIEQGRGKPHSGGERG